MAKYRLRIEDERQLEIHEYNGCKLIYQDKDMIRLRFDRSPEYSMYMEHPDYYLFTVFKDGTVNRHDYVWHIFDDALMGEGYINADTATFKVINCRKMGA